MKFRSDLRQARERRFSPIVHIEDAVWRERLISMVLSAPPTTARLTIVAAPAGFGKTTMLAQSAHHAQSNGVTVAWLNCDARDRDPDIFSEDLLAALSSNKSLSRTKGLAQASNVADVIAEIEEPLVIFIDEYEVASTALVDEVIETIASEAPPNVSIVLASRESPHIPLTRLQLAGTIRIVDANLLRFSTVETRSLLKDCMPANAVQQVAVYADGWPFALQLARLRAVGGASDNLLLESSAKIPRRQIFDYLAVEVLSTLKPETIAFLTDVAVLDALDVPSANAVRQREDSLGFIQELLALKPIIVVDESNWSARLHPLLRDYFVDSVAVSAPGRHAELHLRAARHLAERQRVYEAVEHAVAASRLDVAVRMIEDAGAILVLLSEGGLRVRALLQQLPAATILRHPRLRLLQLSQQLALGLSTGLEFERLERLVSENDTDPEALTRMELEIGHTFALIAKSEQSLQFSPWSVLDIAKQAALACAADDRRPLCMCLAVEITMLHRYGPVGRCERRTAEIERIYRNSDYLTKPWVSMYQARNAFARGELDNSQQVIRHSLQQDVNFVQYRPQFLGQITTVVLGNISFQRGDVLEALAQFSSIVPAESFNMFEIHVAALVEPAICEAALGNTAHAIEMLESARYYAGEENLPHLAAIAAATQLEFEVRFGEPTNAEQLAVEINFDELWLLARTPLALPWIEVEAIARARFFLQTRDEDRAAALDTAETLLSLSLTAGYHLSEITALVMRSHALRLLGREQESRRDLQRALAFAQKCGAVQIFIGFGAEVMVQVRTLSEQSLGLASAWAAHVVKAWESTFRVRSSATSAFTPRELDVLCELAKDQPTKMIAKTLTLSPETVKKHLKAIFVKLEVGKREDAVAQARRRALMP